MTDGVARSYQHDSDDRIASVGGALQGHYDPINKGIGKSLLSAAARDLCKRDAWGPPHRSVYRVIERPGMKERFSRIKS